MTYIRQSLRRIRARGQLVNRLLSLSLFR